MENIDDVEYFTIQPAIINQQISWEEIDYCLDVINENTDNIGNSDNQYNPEDNEFEYNRLVIYILQRMYLSGQKETTAKEVDNKVKELLVGRMLDGLKDKEILEVLTDNDGEEHYRLTPFGKAVAKEMHGKK